MYKPTDYERPEYPVFVKINGRFIPWFSGKGLFVIVCALIVALVSVKVLGGMYEDVERVKTPEMVATEFDALTLARSLTAYDEVVLSLEPLSDGAGKPKATLSPEELERYYTLIADKAELSKAVNTNISQTKAEAYALAEEHGITPETTDEELRSFIAETYIESTRVFSGTTLFLIAVCTVLLPGALVAEFEGQSAAKRIADAIRFARKRHDWGFERSAF